MKVPQEAQEASELPQRLAELTTLRLGGPARAYFEATTEAELVEVIGAADRVNPDGPMAFVLGGGSNLVVADAGIEAQVVAVRTRGIDVQIDNCSGVWVTAAAGESWDDLVAMANAEGWVGIESLAGIPGLVGATPMQNVGAYGQEIAHTVARVRTFDRFAGAQHTFAASGCAFGYRTSRFKTEPGRYVILEVTLQLQQGSQSEPIRYAELATALGIEVGQRAPLARVRAAVLQLRTAKGMVLDAADHDTWSAGSFFTNPILPGYRVPEGAPTFEQPDGRVKTSAAWLIEHAGFAKGYVCSTGRASISYKHTLALTNRGGATTAELVDLAREIRDGVRERFGIDLEPEPVLIGVSLETE